MTGVTEFPLCWPPAFARAKAPEKGAFRTSLVAALNNVRASLVRFAADSRKPISGIVISSNVSLGVTKPKDPGVAVWFTWDGLQVCIPVDRYSTVEGNLQAIHHILEARRTELRHGTLALVRATFSGFTTLPPPKARYWREVFGFRPEKRGTVDEVEARYRQLARLAHPDVSGGSHEAMSELNNARDEALKELSNV